jgi:hypothetical protein
MSTRPLRDGSIAIEWSSFEEFNETFSPDRCRNVRLSVGTAVYFGGLSPGLYWPSLLRRSAGVRADEQFRSCTYAHRQIARHGWISGVKFI